MVQFHLYPSSPRDIPGTSLALQAVLSRGLVCVCVCVWGGGRQIPNRSWEKGPCKEGKSIKFVVGCLKKNNLSKLKSGFKGYPLLLLLMPLKLNLFYTAKKCS